MAKNASQPLEAPTLEIQAKLASIKKSSFYAASCLLPIRVRHNVRLLYALCREADDIADSDRPANIKRQELKALEQQWITGKYAPLVRDRLCLDKAVVEAFFIGLQQDTYVALIDSREALTQYSYYVAGTVGLMLARCFGLPANSPANKHAVDLGIGMQLTNIARDIVEDARLGRRYWPKRWLPDTLRKASTLCNPAQLSHDEQAQLKAVQKKLLRLADRYYVSGLQGLNALPADLNWSLALAAYLYRAQGNKRQSQPVSSWEKAGNPLSRLEKLGIAIHGLWRWNKQVRFKKNKGSSPAHSALLHQGLSHLLPAYCRASSAVTR